MIDMLAPLMQRVQALGTPAPGGWGTYVTPEGGSSFGTNLEGVGGAFVNNLGKSDIGGALSKAVGGAISGGEQAAAPTPTPMPATSDNRQAEMGQTGMQSLLASGRRSPQTGGGVQAPFQLASGLSRSIY